MNSNARGKKRKPTALISVFNKTGIVEFAAGLKGLGWNLLASGGTKKVLKEAGVKVRDVSALTGGGAILGHRVVTLSREVFAGILANPNEPKDMAELKKLRIPFIDLVCVDMYPLSQEIAKFDNFEVSSDSVVEKTDIGGPSMLRAAAKARRIVICDPTDRPLVLGWLRTRCGPDDRDRYLLTLAAKAERVVSAYCKISADHLESLVALERVSAL